MINTISRNFDKTKDYKKVIDFLYRINKKDEQTYSWLPQRFEYWFHFGIPFTNFMFHGNYDWESQIRIWENENGELIGVVNPEGAMGDFFIQIDPKYKFIEEEIVDWIERNMPDKIKKFGSNKIRLWAYDNDEFLINILEKRRYMKLDWYEMERFQSIDKDFLNINLEKGYTIQTLDSDKNLQNRCKLSADIFNYDEFPASVYRNMQKSSMYKKDLDLVAIDANGNYAAFCTIWFYPELNIGVFEPVGTHPEHRKKGLAKALIYEGLKRLKKLGAESAQIGSYDEPAHALYHSCGFIQYRSFYPFEKEF